MFHKMALCTHCIEISGHDRKGAKRRSGTKIPQLWQQGRSEADECCLSAWIEAGGMASWPFGVGRQALPEAARWAEVASRSQKAGLCGGMRGLGV